MEKKCYYVVAKVQPWTNLAVNGHGLKTQESETSVGFLQVYGSLEDLRAAWPTADYFVAEGA